MFANGEAELPDGVESKNGYASNRVVRQEEYFSIPIKCTQTRREI